MEEFLLDYLFHSIGNELLKGNDYATLIFLLRKSYEEGLPEKIKVTSSDGQNALGLTSPTFNKSLDNLEFAGIISKESFRGMKGGNEIEITFLQDLYNTRSFSEDSTREVESALHSMIPKSKNYLQTKTLFAKKTSDSDEIKYKDSLQLIPDKYKDSLQLRLENIKKFYNSFTINIKEFYNLENKYKDSLHFSPLKYKVSLHFFIDAKSINLNDLTKIEADKYRNIRSFFARLGTIYNRKYITIINIIDTLFFEGRLFDTIEDNVIEQKSAKKSSKYSKEYFTLNDETEKHIPLHLHNHKETIYGEELTFRESISNWIEYKESAGDPVTLRSMIRTLKFLGGLKNPIESIEESIRATAKNIFHVQKRDYRGSSGGNDTDNEKVGRVRRWK